MSTTASGRLTFFLIGMGGSGGVRVAIQMANELARRGRSVRLAIPRPSFVERLRTALRRPFTWEDTSRVPIVRFSTVGELGLAPGECAVAVGSQLAHLVAGIHEPGVQRLLWCHGIIENQPDEMRAAWSLPVPKISVSPTLVERLRSYGGGEVLGIVPNGIDPQEYFVTQEGPRDGIGLIYRDHWTKDPELALRVIARLQATIPHVPLRVFGFGPRPRELRKVEYARSPGVPQARSFYNRSLIWLVTSRSEGFCLPILEAMACGAAVVSTAHVSAPGLIEDGRNGRIVPIGEEGPMLQAVEELLADSERRAALVAEGHRTAAQYSWPRAAEAMEASLEELRSRS